jgi:putative membrane protein
MITGVIGLLAAIGLVAYFGRVALARALLIAGWTLLLIPIYHVLPLALAAFGWYVLLHRDPRRSAVGAIYARWVCEGVDNLLPVAQVGGSVVGARILALRGVGQALAGASAVVDLTTQIAAQLIYTLIGFGILLNLGNPQATHWATFGISLTFVGLVTFVAAQHLGGFVHAERWLERLAQRQTWASSLRLAGLHENIVRLYRDRSAVLLSCSSHLIGWILGTVETWLALHFMNHTVSLRSALMLESLSMAIRSGGFFVPGALGIQEAAYLFIGHTIGLPPQIGLAVSLAKRGRDLVLGIPALLFWHFEELHRALRSRRGSRSR